MSISKCPQCGATFGCCPLPDQRCWCLELPALPREELGQEANVCYCPSCLKAKLSAVAKVSEPTSATDPRHPPAEKGEKWGKARS